MPKRKIIKIDESRCTGCGDCITACAEGAIEEREAEEFDLQAAREHQLQKELLVSPCTAPLSMKPQARPAEEAGKPRAGTAVSAEAAEASQLSSWPIQMRLVRPGAPYPKGASLLVAGDCTVFAYPGIQAEFIKGRVPLVGCPKLDEKEPFITRLSKILAMNDIKDITVLHMTVPCCAQLDRQVREAVKRSGKDIPVKSYVVGIEGSIREG